nr:ATP-dependent DNA helicase UvrD2 [Corynebacterium lactis]
MPDYLSGLDPDQREAATAPMGPVCILAGAGTGKTRTITHRIKYLIDQGFVQPQKILAVTFTSRAAGEMRDRLASMGTPGVQARTFHSAALRQLRYFWPQVAGDMPWQLLDDRKFRVVAQAVRRVGLDGSKETIRDVMGEIEWAKATLAGAEQYAAALKEHGRTAPIPVEKVIDCYRAYEDIKTTPDGLLLDFDDLLLHTAGAMENSRAVAEEFRNQYRCFVVDEYQDVTPLQQRVLNAWLGDRDNLTVVGDANQTIYSFTGATPHYLMNFSRDYPEATVVRLQRDYRSTPQVVELANDVIGRAQGRIAGSRLKLVGQRADGPEPTFNQYDDEPMEARATARTIKRLIDSGVQPSEIAVLYRINAQSAVFEQALSEVGVPYQVRGGDGFYQRPEIRDAISALVRVSRAAAHLKGQDLLAQVKQVFAGLGLTEQEPEGAGARERWQSLGALFDLCRDLVHSTPELNIQALLGQLHTRQQAKHPPTLQGVTLASLHAAKGLEWDAVFLVGLTDGALPIQHALRKLEQSPAQGAEAIEEERRLFYVGITRAREHLELSWSLARAEGGRKSRKRSRFLDGLDIGVSDHSTAPAPSRRSKRKSRQCKGCTKPLFTDAERISGRCEECPVTADPQLVDAIRAWRLEVSKEMSVPAFVVFSDATLLAIAEQQPTTPEELLEIPGIGEAKLTHYGEGILALVNSFVDS